MNFLRSAVASLALTGLVVTAGVVGGPTQVPVEPSASKSAVVDVRHVHVSTYQGATPAALAVDIDALRHRTDIITVTEMERRKRANGLKEPGWTRVWFAGPGTGENAILVRDSVWTVRASVAKKLTAKKYIQHASKAKSSPLHATTALLQHNVSGRRLTVSAAHLPSMIEGTKRLLTRDKARTRTYKRAVAGWRNHVNAWNATHVSDGLIVTADWNLDLKKKWVRVWVKNRMPVGLTPAFKAPYPRGGTHDGERMGNDRIIDFALLRGLALVAPTVIGADIDSSDHHPVHHLLRFR